MSPRAWLSFLCYLGFLATLLGLLYAWFML